MSCLRRTVLILIPCCLGITWPVSADIVTSFKHVNGATGGPVIYTQSTAAPPNGVYTFQVDASQSIWDLKAKAGVNVSVSHGESPTEIWQSSEASASSTANFIDIATVQGNLGGSSGGTVILTWVLSGSSQLALDTTGTRLTVFDLSTTTTLSTTTPAALPGMEEVLFHSYLDGASSAVSSNEDFSETFADVFTPITFEVPWSAGTNLPVEFELTTSVSLDLAGSEVDHFTAGLLADFFSTATLVAADVYDLGGGPLIGARLVGNGGAYPVSVPEPSAFLLFVFAATFAMTIQKTLPRCRAVLCMFRRTGGGK